MDSCPFFMQELSFFNNVTVSLCSGTEGDIKCEPICVLLHVDVCVCHSSTSSHLGNRPCSLNFSYFPPLGTHSFRPNPVHSLLILTLVVEAIHRLCSSYFCSNKEKNSELARVVGALRGDHPPFSTNSEHLFSPLSESNNSHTYLMWTSFFWRAPFPKVHSYNMTWVHNSRAEKCI